MDWLIASPGGDVQTVWGEGLSMVGWGVLIWVGVGAAATLALLLLPIICRAVRRRRIWCDQAEGEVEVEFEEEGIFDCRRAVAVLSCSMFDPPTQVRCRRSCLDRDVRVQLQMNTVSPVEVAMIAELVNRRPADELDPEDWWSAIDGEILDCLREHGSATVNELCEELGLSEGSATAFLAMLAREGRVRLLRVELVA